MAAAIFALPFAGITHQTDLSSSAAYGHSCSFVSWNSDGDPTTYRTFVGVLGRIRPGVPFIFFCGGNMQYAHQAETVAFARKVHEATSLPIVVFDYPGYGRFAQRVPAQGRTLYSTYHQIPHDVLVPTERLACEAATHVFADIRNKYPLSPAHVFGYSIGAKPACAILRTYPTWVRKLLLVSPFPSCARYLTGQTWIRLPYDAFDTFHDILQLKSTPATYLAYPLCDTIIQRQHIAAFFRAFRERGEIQLEEIPGETHTTVLFQLSNALIWLGRHDKLFHRGIV